MTIALYVDTRKVGSAVDKLRHYAKDCGEDLGEGEPTDEDLRLSLQAVVQYILNGVLEDPDWYLNDTSHSLCFEVFETALRHQMGES